ncbi:PhnD/SsuA/transferrin family substrate-binding protein [Pseudomonadota bacterium]
MSFTTQSDASKKSTTVTVGVLAHRGNTTTTNMWTPTINYLTENIPGNEFQLLPLDLDGMSAALEQRKVDFILTNPGNYVELERQFGITRIVTLRNLRHGNPYTLFGSVIFVRADREDLHTLADLKNGSFGAVDKDAFGGFQMAWRELKDEDINPFSDFSNIQFYGFPQDNIVLSVLDKKIDAGTVRTDVLERMATDGQIKLEDFRILNQKTFEDFPFHLSSRLYPEWAFAKTRFTADELAETVAIALMNMAENDSAAIAGQYAGWTVPLNYQTVHELFMDLEIGPYQKLGKPSLIALITEYWYWLAPILAIILLSIFHNFLVKRQVALQTGKLSQTNYALKKEVAERRKAEEDARNLLEEKRFLAQKCIQVQEDERHHLARELHDELGQCITAIQADAETIQKLSKNCDARLETSARAIWGVSSRIYEVVHSMMQRLRPSALDDVGLVETLKEEVHAWQVRQPGTRYSLNTDGNLDTLGELINITLYRIVQECLTNIAKHSKATEVVIELAIIDSNNIQKARLHVQDDGVGMKHQSIRKGFGLIGIQERVETLKGKFELLAGSGSGMNITVTLPLIATEKRVHH